MSNGPGAYVGIGDPRILEDSSSATSIGQTVLDSLSKSISTNDVCLPKNLADITMPTLRAAGVKSWREFVRGSKSIDVERNINQIVLQLLKREGTNFVLGSKKETLEKASAKDIGEAVQRLFRIRPINT